VNEGELFETIYSYYPQNCNYLTDEYQKSKYHLLFLNKINDTKNRRLVKNNIFNVIQNIFPDNYITEWTDETYPSVHFSILMNKYQDILDDDIELLTVLNGIRIDLEIYISLLEKYYYTYIIETNKFNHHNELSFKIEDENNVVEIESLNLLRNELFSLGYNKLSKNVAHKIVPNIETELLYDGEVKIFNCLFSDMEKEF
jgi:hypothetical protein